MRVAGLIAVLLGLGGLSAAASGPTLAPVGQLAASTVPGARAAAASALAGVVVRPGALRAGRAQAGPPTTADCERPYELPSNHPAQSGRPNPPPPLHGGGVPG